MSHRQATAITTLAAAAALSAGPAFAQQQVNNSGRAHDANPQVGSGGRNDTVGGQALDYRQRNDIITGNVTGGFEFRGNIDYTAPGEFQGNLGSDDLFRFNARSFQSAPTSLSGTAPSVNLGGVPSVYRGFSTPTAGAGVINAQAYQLTRVAPNNGATTYAQITGTNPYNYTNAATSVRDAANQLGYTTLEGQTFAVTASPLLGIRQDQIPQPNLPGQSLNVNLEVPGTVRPQTAPGLDPTQPTPAHRLTPEEEAERTANDPRIQARLGTEPFRPLLTEDYRRQVLGIGPDGMPIGPEAAQGTQDPNAVRDGGVNQSGQITPTRVMGQQLQGMLRGSGRGGERDLAAEQRLNRVGEDLMNRAAQQQSQGRQSAYGQLLEQVQRTPGDRQAPGRPGAPGDPLTPNLADPMNPLDAIQNEQVIQAEIDRMKALDRVYGNRPGTVGSDSRAARDPLNAAQGSEAMQQLLNQLNYEAAPLRTLSGEEEGQVSRLLRQAEQALASGQYFDAETLYRQVISISPADPMPRIGLVHAQLGAGMIRSAAVNLRQLFDTNPEVIAARYAGNLLPPEERLQWLRGELERAIATGEGGADPAFVMAYLGYQVGSNQLIRYGLATAESRAPLDPLLPVVRAIWLDGRSSEAAGPGEQPLAPPAQPASAAGEDVGTSTPPPTPQ